MGRSFTQHMFDLFGLAIVGGLVYLVFNIIFYTSMVGFFIGMFYVFKWWIFG